MDTANNSWEKLIALMEEECGLAGKIINAVRSLRTQVHSRDWVGLECSFKKTDSLLKDLGHLEQMYKISADCICKGRELEALSAELEPELRQKYTETKSRLKARLLLVQSRTQDIAGYAAAQYKLSQDLMESQFPAFKGKIYDSRGRTSPGMESSVVLSRHL
ncbi:MAG: hypothetical protein B0D92_01065 [Spirochaeta sp. LUC14_002_19_P3]|nr:MAG: hypothetical protein B0D92_01065 [Spirochaeta sp. LUC14_002_19_P3]